MLGLVGLTLLLLWVEESAGLQQQQQQQVPKFCQECGSDRISVRVPPRDERARAICDECGWIHYVNPKVICGCVVRDGGGSILLARRSIEPRLGLWGIPQGYMECGETTRECAARECFEETGFAVDDVSKFKLISVYNLPNQVQLLYDLQVDGPISHSEKTLESLEVKLFDSRDIPWPDLAFPTVEWALKFALFDQENVVQQRTKAYDLQTQSWTVVDS